LREETRHNVTGRQREELEMRIVVVGAGGVGGLIGGLLAHSGADVAFVARGRQLEALRAHGLRVESSRGSFHVPSVSVSDDPASLAPADAVLVAVKAWQVAELAPSLLPLLATGGFALPLENGVEAADHLAAALGEQRVVGGLCAMLAWIEAPGVIRHEGPTLRVVVGERQGGVSARVQALVTQLSAAKIDAVVADDIAAAAWEKLLFIASFGAVGAVTRATADNFRSVPESRALLLAAMHEVAALASARGIELRAGAVERALGMVDALPLGATASMQRDIMAGRPSELNDQSGAIVRMAQAAKVPVPTHAFLLSALLPQELAARAGYRSPSMTFGR
jgi:2-dehydropantoate 2-reductase